MKLRALAAALAIFSFTHVHAESLNVTASTREYNRLVFPEPYDRIVIPPTAALADKPMPLQGHRGVLIRPAPGAGPIPVFVQLRSGESFTVRLIPDDKAPGAVFRYRDATDYSVPPPKVGRPADTWIAEVMLQALEGERPDGFESADLPPAARLYLDPKADDRLELQPVARYRGSLHELSVYRLRSTKLVNVEPRDFYREGVVAVLVESDVTSQTDNPLLLVLEVSHE